MMDDKAPGDSGMNTDMIKNLPQKLYYSTWNSQEFWNNEEINFKLWHTTLYYGTQPS